MKAGKLKHKQAMEKRSNKQTAKIIVRLRKKGWTPTAIAYELNSDDYQTSMGKLLLP